MPLTRIPSLRLADLGWVPAWRCGADSDRLARRGAGLGGRSPLSPRARRRACAGGSARTQTAPRSPPGGFTMPTCTDIGCCIPILARCKGFVNMKGMTGIKTADSEPPTVTGPAARAPLQCGLRQTFAPRARGGARGSLSRLPRAGRPPPRRRVRLPRRTRTRATAREWPALRHRAHTHGAARPPCKHEKDDTD
jgi:hypothetical protein